MSRAEFDHLLQTLAILSPEQLHQLRRQVDSQLTTVSPPGEASAFDVLSRSGLIGCVDGGPESPTDLSTNPVHMEGFGRD